jgi:hypothetical protein
MGGDLELRGGQVEDRVKAGQVLADVADRGRGQPLLRQRGQHYGHAAAIDPAIGQRLDAVGHPDLARE